MKTKKQERVITVNNHFSWVQSKTEINILSLNFSSHPKKFVKNSIIQVNIINKF